MIDWNNIKIRYPNALNVFVSVMFPNIGVPCISILKYYDLKNLYRFFEKQGISLNVEMFTKDSWLYTITMIDGKVFLSCGEFKPTRDLIEIDGFNECFKLLEKKIENNSTIYFNNKIQ